MNITVGQILTFLGAVGGAIGAVVLIVQWIKKILTSVMDKNCEVLRQGLNSLKQDIENTNKSVNEVNMNYIKTFLVSTLSSAERGENLTEIDRLRFSEEYDYYINHDGNSYVKDWYKRLHEQGVL